MNKNNASIFETIIAILVGGYFLFSIFDSCTGNSTKAKAFEKMQENPNLTTEEALEEVQNEEDLNSARDWY
jgi:hypothetical protein